MKLIPNNFYHIYNRGNNKERIFFNQENYKYFLNKIKSYLCTKCNIICYCLMPNHFHFMIHIPENFDQRKFSNAFKICLSSYTRAINLQENRTGSLFQQHTRFKNLNEENRSEGYALICFNYIHQNPFIAGIVDKMEDWEYSSFQEYAGFRKWCICNKELAYYYLGISKDYEEFYKFSYDIINKDKVKKIFY